MLSILIPTFNQDITRLVTDLNHQAMQSDAAIEIIVMEDGSDKEKETNRLICKSVNCKHIILDENIGRSACRNKLADEAKFEHLLFIDCDAEVCTTHFIERYLTFCHETNIVIGGTAYDPNENNPNFSLRLKYGREREARTALERGKNNFATFNFLIPKSIFNRVRFDESIRSYGHEDTLFGHQLRLMDCEFLHIDNPLIHKGLDDNKTFIRKTEEGTRNLYLLYKTGRYPFLPNESKLLKSFLLIDKLHFTEIMALKFDFIFSFLHNELCKSSPSLLLYDFYKLLYLCKTARQK